MNREIKFRGKRYGDKSWVYGNLYQGTKEGEQYSIILNDTGYHVAPQDDRNFAIAFFENEVNVVFPNTVGQYTGLKDKNDKEIYEGDIVLTPFIDPIFGDMVGEDLCVKRQVKFNDGSFVVNVSNGFIYLECFTRNNHIEICGNIHDNPELVEQ